MNHATNCKFCKAPITLEIDDEYSEFGDPYKLLRYAACNYCADVRVERRFLERRIARTAVAFACLVHPKEDEIKLVRGSLTKLYELYAKNIAAFHRKEGMCWDDAVIDAVMAQPRDWPKFCGRLWKMFYEWNKQQEMNV